MSEDLTKKLPTTDSDKLTSILMTVQNLAIRLGTLEQKVEERLHDTRPIWQKLVTDIAEVRTEVHNIRTEVHDIRTSQRDGLRRMSVFHDTLIAMQADYRDIYDRVRGLETNRNQQNSST
jgi:septal ring factor EnvC (AmiA/AmiB activator)